MLVGAGRAGTGSWEGGGEDERQEGRVAYLVHLDRHDAARLDRALGPDSLGAAYVAADVIAADVGDGVVGRRETDALGSVETVRSHRSQVMACREWNLSYRRHQPRVAGRWRVRRPDGLCPGGRGMQTSWP